MVAVAVVQNLKGQIQFCLCGKILACGIFAALEKIVDEVLANPATKQAQEDFKAGQEKVIGFLVGQVMKASQGKANPSSAQEILRQKLKN